MAATMNVASRSKERKGDFTDLRLDENVMELEHVMGYAGHSPQTCLFHPSSVDTIVYSIGAVLVIGNRSDPHEQKFIQGHDAEICAMSISKDGRYIASGQLGSKIYAGNVAPVLVWDSKTLRNVYVFDNLKVSVDALEFSPDGRFLAASSRDLCIIWDMEIGSIVATKRMQKSITLLSWGCVTEGQRTSRPVYRFNLACSSQVVSNTLAYDVSSVRYVLSSKMMTMPTGGLVRNYTASLVPLDTGRFLIAGCGNGEVCVFSAEHNIFRASIPVATNGVISLCSNDDNIVYVGAGDGSVKELSGSDCEWEVKRTAKLTGRVMSLSFRADGRSLLAGTSHGNIYELNLANFEVSLLSASHVDGVNAVAFAKSLNRGDSKRIPNDIFCSASNDGTVRLWSLSDYSTIARIEGNSAATCASLFQRADGFRVLLTGWRDRSIRAYDTGSGCGGKHIFTIPNAHRTPITCIDVAEQYFVSGDNEGTVRVWTWRRELLCQFSEHKKSVTAVVSDNRVPHRLHSCGLDGLVLTYDLRMERRVNSHFLRRKAFQAMVQREDSEQELVVVTGSGDIFAWDCDESSPVMTVDDSDHPLQCASLSSTGRYLAAAGDDCVVKVYDLLDISGKTAKSPRLVAVGSGHFSTVLDLSWSPDEKQIVSVSGNCSMCVWNFYGNSLGGADSS